MLAIFCPVSFALSGSSKPPNFILITVDTMRADRMGFLGSQLGLTPNLDSLARQSAVFSRAYAHVPLTTPSHATILTGTYPQFNHVGDLGAPLSKDLPDLAEILEKRGYRTAAFVGSQVLDPKGAAAPGFDRGFEVYDAGFHSRRTGEDRYSSEERRAAAVVDHALAWLKRTPRTTSFFLWVHLYDPHDPFEPPEPFKTKYAAAPYDGEIAYVDAALGRLFARLKAQGIYERAIIAVVADHGEALGEHGEESHGFFLYDETVHVPLLIKLPNERSAGRRVDVRVGLVDVAPTLLEVAGIPAPASMQGVSLMRWLKEMDRTKERAKVESDPGRERPIYSETDYPHRSFGWSSLRSLRSGRFLYIDAPHRELYDEVNDPQAQHNLADALGGVADTLHAQLEAFCRKTSGAAGAAMRSLSPEQAEQLQALGYLTADSSSTGKEGIERGADPKERIQIANLMHHAVLATEEERYAEAVPLLQRVLKDEPMIALANLDLGRSLNSLGDFAQALPWLRKAVELAPNSGRAHYELGVALGETGDWNASVAQWEEAVARAPDSDDLHFHLAMAYAELDRRPEAENNFRDALRINPAHYRANLFLGRLLGMHDNPAAALTYLQRAVKLEPNSPDAHKFLANVYTELGREEEARQERDEADRLRRQTVP